MTDSVPLTYTWDGDAMSPIARFRGTADRQFVIGDVYRLALEEERSPNTHRHFFAILNEAWRNLPEDLAPRFPSVDSLRYWSLIKCGFCDEQSIVCDTAQDARKVAAFLSRLEGYAVVVVKGTVVSRYTAQSQSMRAMDKAKFQESKQAVLELVAAMIGLTAAELAAEVKKQGFADDTEDEQQPETKPEPQGSPPVAARQVVAIIPPATPDTPAGGAPAKRRRGPNKPKLPKEPEPEAKAVEPEPTVTEKPQEPAPKTKAELDTPTDYVAYAKAWIYEATAHQPAIDRYDCERGLRDDLKVPIGMRMELQNLIASKFGGQQ